MTRRTKHTPGEPPEFTAWWAANAQKRKFSGRREDYAEAWSMALAPLTDAELSAAVQADDTLRYFFSLNGGAGPVSAKGILIFRAVERAIGIKERS